MIEINVKQMLTNPNDLTITILTKISATGANAVKSYGVRYATLQALQQDTNNDSELLSQQAIIVNEFGIGMFHMYRALLEQQIG